MKKTNFPVKKTFVQDFLNKKGDKLFTLKYEQATILEYYEFTNKTPEEQGQELLDILTKHIKYSFKDKIFKFLNKNYVSDIEKSLNIKDITISIFQNRYRHYTSIFEGYRIKDPKNKNKGAIESVGLANICTSYCISPTDLMNNYTLEQYFWFLDGIEFMGNCYTDNGHIVNNMATVDREGIKERAEDTKAKFAKFKK